MTTYFGLCNSSGTIDPSAGSGMSGINSNTTANNHGSWTLTCPGTGAQSISDLKCYCRASSGSGGIRLAVFNSARNDLINQGDAEVTVTTTAGWFGHTSFSTGDGLTGGTSYTLAVTVDSAFWQSDLYYSADWSTMFGWTDSSSADFTGGFSDSSLSGGSEDYTKVALRCGVDAAGGASIVPLVMHNRRHLGG